MKRLLIKILGGDTVSPTSAAKKCLLSHFKTAKSIEWSETDNGFEAIFYIKNQEYISRISTDGKLLEYKININPSSLPEAIKLPAGEHGELMNAISIHKPNHDLIYELITRNQQLERFTVIYQADGTLVKKEKL